MLATATGHLEYYTKHAINPVRYRMDNLREHFDRRGSLYRTLGITPLAVRGAAAIEIAPGTGQNSLYLASLNPESLTLVEPNPVAIRDIHALYATAAAPIVSPVVIESRFQDFEPRREYDVVVCENWLGCSPQERQMLRKLGGLAAPGGLLSITTVSPVGVLSNALRKALTCRLDDPSAEFLERTRLLSTAFGPHLLTIPGMTRSVTDWVHDNVMNPAYFGVLLTIPMAIDDLDDRFDVLGSSPRFAADWRWFKSLAGEKRDFNRHFLAEYRRNLHNFFDYRILAPERDPAKNTVLEEAAWAVCESVYALELDLQCGRPTANAARTVGAAVRRVLSCMTDLPGSWSRALNEFLLTFEDARANAEQVAGLEHFGPLFGRETVYVSFERTR
ncbi:MAG: class I SAM-dependent methyltransferase [Gemmataceae bacterium]